MSERFKKSWSGWIRSSDGYSIRVGSRTGIDYRDGLGELHISSEVMASPSNKVVVYTRSIPDTAERPQAEVMGRLQRAFTFGGLILEPEDAN